MANDYENCILEPNFKFSRLNSLGEPPIVRVCPSKPWSIYSACNNLRAQHPIRAEIQSPEKCALRWVPIHVNNFFVCGPKFTVFFSSNVGGVVFDQLLFRFSTCGSISEIFVIKVESCQKSRPILDVFRPPKF